MYKQFICIRCPKGCIVDTEYNEKPFELTSIKGNSCPRGKEYVIGELTDPRRPLTTTLRIEGAITKVIPVMTSCEIKKGLLFDVMKELSTVVVQSPVKKGDVLVKNVLNTGADMIAQTDM